MRAARDEFHLPQLNDDTGMKPSHRRNPLTARAEMVINDCPDCDDFGRLDDLRPCPRRITWAQAQNGRTA